MFYVSSIINDLSGIAVSASVYGAAAYLCARAVKQMDPKIAVACAVTARIIMGLFMNKRSNFDSKAVGLAALAYVPFKVCEKLALPATFKMTATISAISLAAYIILSSCSGSKKSHQFAV